MGATSKIYESFVIFVSVLDCKKCVTYFNQIKLVMIEPTCSSALRSSLASVFCNSSNLYNFVMLYMYERFGTSTMRIDIQVRKFTLQ